MAIRLYRRSHQAESRLAYLGHLLIENRHGLIADAMATSESTGEHCYQAELYRLKGERLLGRAADRRDVDAAEQCLEAALAIARRQRAQSLEERAAMSLARLRSGRR